MQNGLCFVHSTAELFEAGLALNYPQLNATKTYSLSWYVIWFGAILALNKLAQ